MTQGNAMSGSLGDVFWDLPPRVPYAPGFDLGCSIYVANTTDAEKEYALMARLSRGDTVISEEALPVSGRTWFTVEPDDFIKLSGALRFAETDAELAVLLVERETEEVTDSVAAALVAPQAGALPPWPAPGSSGSVSDWSWLPLLLLPLVMLAAVAASRGGGEKEKEKQPEGPERNKERKLLTEGGKAALKGPSSAPERRKS